MKSAVTLHAKFTCQSLGLKYFVHTIQISYWRSLDMMTTDIHDQCLVTWTIPYLHNYKLLEVIFISFSSNIQKHGSQIYLHDICTAILYCVYLNLSNMTHSSIIYIKEILKKGGVNKLWIISCHYTIICNHVIHKKVNVIWL